MKGVTFFIAALVLSLLLSSCNTTDPPIDDDNLQPGRRDYTWTADTLWTEDFFGIHDVWGSSPNSIWMVASGTSAKDCLWYYNGVKWARYNQLLSPSLGTVFGITSDEIWIGDSYGTIWINTGNGWQVFQQFSLSGFDRVAINSIYGTSANNLYAVGFADENTGTDYKGIILKYIGTEWVFLNIPETRVGFNDIKRMSNGKYLITATNVDSGFLEKIFIYDGVSTLKEIYSDYYYPLLHEIKGEIYVDINKKIYKCSNEKLVLWKEFPGTNYRGTVLGRTEKDFFGSGYDGILHYNGTDLANLFPAQLGFYGACIFEKDVFFAGYISTNDTYVMIRGTLKE